MRESLCKQPCVLLTDVNNAIDAFAFENTWQERRRPASDSGLPPKFTVKRGVVESTTLILMAKSGCSTAVAPMVFTYVVEEGCSGAVWMGRLRMWSEGNAAQPARVGPLPAPPLEVTSRRKE